MKTILVTGAAEKDSTPLAAGSRWSMVHSRQLFACYGPSTIDRGLVSVDRGLIL